MDQGTGGPGAYPKSFSTLKLGESHFYFYNTPGALTFPIPSWFTGRAFAPPEKGGMPANFPLGIMKYPLPERRHCPECKTLAVAGSYVMYSKGKKQGLRGRALEVDRNQGKRHEMVWRGVAAKRAEIRPGKDRLPTEYFAELNERNNNAKYFFGTPLFHYRAKCAETYTQVMNNAFPAGLIGVQEAAEKMDAACLKR